jgi:methanogenic corrinoid protein MtbC1
VAAGTKAVQATGAEAQPSGAEPLAQTRGLFLQSLLRGDRKAATGVVLEELRQGTPIESVYVDVFQEALYEIGRRWERNEITVAQEHMATAITQYVVAQMFTRLPVSTLRRGGVVITGVQGELHQVGSNMVADMLEADGWNVHFLGTNIPREGIVQAVEAHEPAILGISCTMLFNLPQVVALLDAVRRRISPFPRVLLGGGAFRSAPDLCQELGAEGYATDLRAAVALARQGDGHA